MKTGKSLVQLAQELESIKQSQHDYMVPASKMKMDVDLQPSSAGEEKLSPRPVLRLDGIQQPFTLNPWSHGQVASYADIPKAYYDRIAAESPGLLADNVNHGLRKAANKTIGGKVDSRMVRVVGESVRAVLSSKYRRLDSGDLLEAVLPTMIENKFEVISTELTDRRLYIKAVTPKVQAEIKQGDVVQYGLVISSSDVGGGSLRVEPLIYRLICLNGMIGESTIRKTHIGRNQAGDNIEELLSDRTRALSDAAFWAQVRDVVTSTMNPAHFEAQVDKIRMAAGQPIKNYNIEQVIELASERVGVTGDKTLQSMVAYLANGADGAGLTRWGLVNAFTFAAQEAHVGYDESVELERAGSKILELPKRDWETISEAS